MGKRIEEPLAISDYDELVLYLRTNHSAYMEVGGKMYYLTDVNSHEWRVQDTSVLNDKGHYTDCSELVALIDEFLTLPFLDGKSVKDLMPEATFYESSKEEKA